MSAPVKGPWFEVPAGTRASECRSCKHVIYWITTKAGKSMPVDTDVDGGDAPTAHEAGQGVSHFSNCPDRDQWRTSR